MKLVVVIHESGPEVDADFDTTIPVEYESKEAFTQDFLVSLKKAKGKNQNSFKFKGIIFNTFDYYSKYSKEEGWTGETSPDIYTLEEWFVKFKTN
jgi:hypothetical protein